MWKNKPKRNKRGKSHVRGWLLMIIHFIKGWAASYAFTHSWTGPMANAGQIQITIAFVLTIALPFAFLAVLDWEEHDDKE